MAGDLINISVVSNFKRNKIPPFSKLENVLESKNIAIDLLQLTSFFIANAEKKDLPEQINLKNYFDEQLNKNLADLLGNLPPKSFAYKFLALNVDFIKIRTVYQNYSGNTSETLKKSFAGLQKNLLLKDMYLLKINDLNNKLSEYKTSFEILTALDKIYFSLLKDFSRSASAFSKKLIALQIDSYNLSSFFRLHRLGKTNSIHTYLIENPDGISIRNLDIQTIENQVAKLMNLTDEITTEKVEISMKKRELQFLKTAIYAGYGEPLILLYVELLKIFFYDIKLVAIYEELHGDKEDIKNHLINYDLK